MLCYVDISQFSMVECSSVVLVAFWVNYYFRYTSGVGDKSILFSSIAALGTYAGP